MRGPVNIGDQEKNWITLYNGSTTLECFFCDVISVFEIWLSGAPCGHDQNTTRITCFTCSGTTHHRHLPGLFFPLLEQTKRPTKRPAGLKKLSRMQIFSHCHVLLEWWKSKASAYGRPSPLWGHTLISFTLPTQFFFSMMLFFQGKNTHLLHERYNPSPHVSGFDCSCAKICIDIVFARVYNAKKKVH